MRKVYSFFIDIAQTLVLAFSLFLVVYAWLFRPFEVSGQSMFPTFHNNEYVLTNLIGLRFENPKRGDVVVFKSPTDADKDFIKRVIGLPGDTVGLQDASLYVNGQKLDESAYLSADVKTYSGAFLREGATITVPEGSYFVVGDNRPYSSDSREWGFVKKDAIIGESLFVYWPPSRMRMVTNPFSK